MSTNDGIRFPTVSDAVEPEIALRSRNRRRWGIGALGLFVALAAAGVLGPSQQTISKTAATGEMITVTAPLLSRPGADVEVHVASQNRERESPFRIALQQQAIADWGIEDIYPEPDRQIADGSSIVLVYDSATDFSVVLAGRTPVRQASGRYRQAIEYASGDGEQIRHEFITWVLP